MNFFSLYTGEEASCSESDKIFSKFPTALERVVMKCLHRNNFMGRAHERNEFLGLKIYVN